MGTTLRAELSEKNPYWIEKHRYYELKHFCLQYPIWKKAYAALDGTNTKANTKDDELKQKQLEEQVKERYFRVGIAAAELMVPLIFYGIWMRKGFKFEETGTYTSKTFTGLINRFRPTKK